MQTDLAQALESTVRRALAASVAAEVSAFAGDKASTRFFDAECDRFAEQVRALLAQERGEQ
jgi:hypothetical protein